MSILVRMATYYYLQILLIYAFLWHTLAYASIGRQGAIAPNITTNDTTYNFNPADFTYYALPSDTLTCAIYCAQTPYCEGYIASLAPLTPRSCYFVMGRNSPVLNITKPKYSNYTQRNCSDYIADDTVCYAHSKVCIACPTHPYLWMDYVQPGYTVYIADQCCPLTYLSSTSREVYFPYPINISTPNLTITTLPRLTIITDKIPFIYYSSIYPLKSIAVVNMTLTFNGTGYNPMLYFTLSSLIQFTFSNITIYNANRGIIIIGGTYANTNIVPITTGMDISNSYFGELALYTYPINIIQDNVLAMMNVYGTDITLGPFYDPYQNIVVQPISSNFNINNNTNPLTEQPHVLNIANMFGEYGTVVNVDYYHKNAEETENDEAIAVKQWIHLLLIAVIIQFIYLILNKNLVIRFLDFIEKQKQE